MKIPAIFFLFLLSTFTVFGQESKISIGVTGSTDFYNMDFLPLERSDASFDPDFNYSIGASARYRFNDNLNVNVKIVYATRDFTLNHNFRFIEPNDPLFFLLPRRTTVDLSYLDLPLSLNYVFLEKKNFDIFLSAGVVPGVLVADKESTVFEDNHEEKTEDLTNDLNSFLISGTLGAGIKYNLMNKLAIILEPQYRYFFNRISDENEDNTPQLFSVAFTAEIRF